MVEPCDKYKKSPDSTITSDDGQQGVGKEKTYRDCVDYKEYSEDGPPRKEEFPEGSHDCKAAQPVQNDTLTELESGWELDTNGKPETGSDLELVESVMGLERGMEIERQSKINGVSNTGEGL
ncbi:hypothetical protein NHQ30_003499 [Ciborinia camelliae]|nr:hypothetical protein NHQ30_003499 [Ciborinia camelliae]